MSIKNKRVILLKGIITGIIFLVLGFWFWYALAGNPFDEYALIKSGIVGKGFITKIDEDEDVVEEGGREKNVPKCAFEYEFKTLDGKLIKDNSNINGHIPDSLTYVNEIPFPISVEYLANYPNVNRIIDMHTGCTSIGEWFWRKVAGGSVLLLIFLSVGVVVVKQALKEYNN